MFATGVALTNHDELLSFDLNNPGDRPIRVKIDGLQPNEDVLAIDYRPATGQLYGLGSTSRLYRIDPRSGVATQVGGTFAVPLSGDSFDIDFNPTVDRIRVTSNADQNLRLNPDTGAVVDGDAATAGVQGDTNLRFDAADPNAAADAVIVGEGYTANFNGAAVTTLYGVDSGLDILVGQGSIGGTPDSPNGGKLFTIGGLGINVTKRLGFDVQTVNGVDQGFAAFQVDGQTRAGLYTVNLQTGKAALVGRLGTDRIVTDLAIAPPKLSAVVLTADNRLQTLDPAAPDRVDRTVRIKGLQDNETILAIDYRPIDELLFGLGSTGRLYTITLKNGRATQVGAGTFAVPLAGDSFDIDFNPTVDRIRLVSNADQNLRLNPTSGAVVDGDATAAGIQGDTDLDFDAADANAGDDPLVVGAAYTNNIPSAIGTTLYVIDAGNDVLATQGSVGGAPQSPNGGKVFTVGALGVDISKRAGFDIISVNGTEIAFMAAQVNGQSGQRLFGVNLRTGAAAFVGTFNTGRTISDIAIVPA